MTNVEVELREIAAQITRVAKALEFRNEFDNLPGDNETLERIADALENGNKIDLLENDTEIEKTFERIASALEFSNIRKFGFTPIDAPVRK